jgi:hypothetical protein
LRVFENRVLRRIRNEELHNLYTLPNIIRVINSMRMRGAIQVARMVEVKNAFKILVGKSESKSQSKDLDVDGRIILEWIVKKYVGRVWTGFIWLKLGSNDRLL